MTFADHILSFNRHLSYTRNNLLPDIRIMNPFEEYEHVHAITERFYRKYYNDNNSRTLILGINPGRLGAGLTGIPFTDPKRLISECGIDYPGKLVHEPSSVFIYDVIRAFGGPEAFYSKFYIHSVCPLGFTFIDKKGKERNYNYYDSRKLTAAVYDFIVEGIEKQLEFGIDRGVCFCFGLNKNASFLKKLNKEKGYFKEIAALEHPRFVIQYKSASKQDYIDKYLTAFHTFAS
jgi:hypothetical protein